MKPAAFAVITLLLITLTADAQTIKPKSIYAKQRTVEIGGDVFYTSTQYTTELNVTTSANEYTVQDFVINGSAGFFVVDGLKLAIEPAIETRSYEGSSSTGLKLYFTPEYVFNMNTEVYPYFGGSVGYTSMSSPGSSQNGFSWGLKGGMKVNALGNVLINLGVSYYRETYNFTDPYLGDGKHHQNILGVKAGLSVFFR